MGLSVLGVVFIGIVIGDLMPASQGFKFIATFPPFKSAYTGDSISYNCKTSDAKANISLWKKRQGMGTAFTEVKPVLNKVVYKDGIITIKHISIQDGGQYQCRAVSQSGQRITQPAFMGLLFISNPPMPTYTFYPTGVQFRALGQSIQLKLTASISKVNITWSRYYQLPGGVTETAPIKGNHSVSERKDSSGITSILTFPRLQLSDGGYYRASASYRSTVHMEYYHFQVFAKAAPKTMKVTSASSNVTEGQNYDMLCEAEGYPPPVITWLKDGEKLHSCERDCSNGDYQIHQHSVSNKTGNTLTIIRAKYSNSGNYSCIATNSLGSQNQTVQLSVYTRPHLSKKGMNLLIYRIGHKVKLECNVSHSNPLPTFVWQYQENSCSPTDNKCLLKVDRWLPVPKTVQRTVVPGVQAVSSGITIPGSEPSSGAAFYQCVAKNTFGNDSFVTALYRYDDSVKDLLVIHPSNGIQTLNVFGTLQLGCVLQNSVIPVRAITWKKDGKDLEMSTNFRITLNRTLNNATNILVTLTVRNLELNDTGLYSCQVAASGANLSKTVHVIVKDLDECSNSPCQNNGTCTNTFGSYRCNCTVGFTGPNCEEDVDECLRNPCQHNSSCFNFPGGYRCNCSEGYTGSNCAVDTNECHQDPCYNGGKCHNTKGGYKCTCKKGYVGNNCENDLDECQRNPCQNKGDCVNTQGSYQCKCKTGFTGKTCEEDIDECDSNPCSAQGTCVNTHGSYRCSCAPGFEGLRCQDDKRKLSTETPKATSKSSDGHALGSRSNERTSSMPMVYVGIGIGLAILIVVVVIVIIMFIRNKKKQTEFELKTSDEIKKQDTPGPVSDDAALV